MSGSSVDAGRRPRKVVIRFLDALLRDTVANWVDSLPGYIVAGAVANGPALVRLCALRSPDVAVVQLGSAGADDLTLIAGLRDVRPEPHVVGLHRALDPRSLLRLHRAGAHRLVSSRFGLAALRAALGEAEAGRRVRSTANGVLSERELEILALISAGCSASDVAEALEISPHTVTNYERRIFAKLDVHSRTQAAAEAARLGLLRGAANGRPIDAVSGPAGPLRDEVTRMLARDPSIAAPVTVLVNPTESCWRATGPEASPIVVVGSEHNNRNAVADAVLRGARAVLADDELDKQLPAVVSLVRAGYLVAADGPMRALLAGARSGSTPRSLTRRERDILGSVALGHSVRETAQLLGIAVKTVQAEQRQLFSKLGARNRPGALALARELGLVDT